MIHFMLEDVRRRYELEKLWALGEEFDDQCREMKEDLEERHQAAMDSKDQGYLETAQSYAPHCPGVVQSHDQDRASIGNA